MDIIFYILCIVAGLFITYILGVQFYKLGQNLKNRFPIIYRIYAIFWGFVGAFILIGALVGIKSGIDNYQHNKKIEKIEYTFKKYASGVDYMGLIDKARLSNHSDKEIYAAAKDGEKLKKVFDELAKEGVTDEEIGKFLNLDPYNNYVSEAQKAANEAVRSEEQAQYTVNEVVNTPALDSPVTQSDSQKAQTLEQQEEVSKTKHHYSDVFIAPDLQERLGHADIFYLQKMIADAKNSGYSDSEIFKMIQETNKYSLIINEFIELGRSNSEISKKFGLKI